MDPRATKKKMLSGLAKYMKDASARDLYERLQPKPAVKEEPKAEATKPEESDPLAGLSDAELSTLIQ